MGGVVKSVGNFLGFGSNPGQGQAQSQQAFGDYSGLRSQYEPQFQQAVTALGQRAQGQGPTQGFLDQYLQQQFGQAVGQQQALAAQNTLRNQAAAQREAARNIANIQAGQAAEGAKLKYADLTGAQQQMTDALLGRIGSFEGASESARRTGAETGAEANRERQRGFERLSGILQGGAKAAEMAGGSGGAAGAAAAAGPAMAASDKNSKKNIKKGDGSIESFLDHLAAYEYDYKEGKGPKGKKTSVMAQDLEKSKVGKQMVKNTKDGKMVDYGQGFAAMLAGMANLHERMKKMEGEE